MFIYFLVKPVPQVKLEGYDADSDGVVYIDYVKGQEFSPVTGSVIGDLDAEVFLRREDGVRVRHIYQIGSHT